MLRAVLYARVSTDGQREEATIDSQIAEIKQRISSDGNRLLPDGCYKDDGYTGELLNRPALDQLRDHARAGQFDIVYVYDRGRLSRRYAYQELIIEELADLEIQFVTLHDTLAETAEDRVLQAMQGVFHEYERVKISERFRRGRLFKVRSGKLLGYLPKYGYRYRCKTKTREAKWLLDEEQAAVIRSIYAWVGDEGLSARQVSLRLFEQQVPPPKGRSATWTKGTIQRILRDETYLGLHHYNKTQGVVPRADAPRRYRKIKRSWRRPRPREEWIPIEVPAIVTREQYVRVQARLAENRRLSPRNAKREYLVRGLVRCTCGAARSGEGCRGHYYYRCAARFTAFPFARSCTQGGVDSRLLDTLVWRELETLLSSPARLRQAAEAWLESEQAIKPTDKERADARHDAIRKELQALQRQEERYGLAFGQGALSLETLQQLTAALQSRRTELNDLFQKNTSEEDPASQNWTVEALMKGVRSALAELDFSNRQWMVRELVERITVGDGVVTIFCHLPVHGSPPDTGLRRSHTAGCVAKLPMALTFKLPPPDIRGRAYSRALLNELCQP